MKLANYHINGARRLGFVIGNELIDPLEAGGDQKIFADTISFIRGGDAALSAARALNDTATRRPMADVRLAAPMIPTTILCSGSNYRAHNAEKANAPLSGSASICVAER